MPVPGQQRLNLIPQVAELQVVIWKGGGWSIGLDVTNEAGVLIDVTGTVASLKFGNGTIWTATTTGSRYTFDIPQATVDAITWVKDDVTLRVTSGANSVVWGRGEASVV